MDSEENLGERSKCRKMDRDINNLCMRFCPEGVSYIPLGEATEMQRGTSITKKNIIEGTVPVIAGGQKPAYYCDKANRDADIITVAGSGAYAGYVSYWDCPVFVSDAFSVKAKEGSSTKYIYYAMQNLQSEIYATKKGGGVPHVHISSIEKMRIPLPPLPIQQEIVRILDTFTNLTAELTAELTARRKQYEYYRDELLTFGEDVPRVQLGNIGPVCMCKRILKSQTNTVGGVPFYKIGTFGKTANAYISEETYQEYRSMYSFPNKGDILISAAGTIGRTVVYDGKPAYFQDSNIVWIANDETRVLNRFLAYCYEKKPWNISSGGTIARLYNENIQKAVIPAPSLERQMQIVSQLEKMEDLCNSITVGLPAEITARQKQYEYYRDKLLTFKENIS